MVSSIKKKTFFDKLYKGVEIVSDAAELLVHVSTKPRVLDFASIGLKILNSYKRHLKEEELNKDGYFIDNGWNYYHMGPYNQMLFDVSMSKSFKFERVDNGRSETSKEFVVDMYGLKVGWNKINNRVYGPYFENNSIEEIFKVFGRAVWETLGSNYCEIISKKSKLDSFVKENYCKSIDVNENMFVSETAISILKRAQAFIDQGHNRSVMIYGSPGSGKSTAMKYVASKIGGFILRINVNDLDDMFGDDLLLGVQLLKPNVLLIDDFDRVFKPESLLTSLEKLNQSIKLLMVSVNNVQRLDKAVIRPGRFDDLICLNEIDKKIQDELIGNNVPIEISEKLRKMPVAYISDFHKRREVLGLEEAISGVEELQNRINEVSANKVISKRKKPSNRNNKKVSRNKTKRNNKK